MMSPGIFQTYQSKELKKLSKLSIKQMNGGCKNPPLAESSIMFDLKGQAAWGPSLINPDSVQFKLKYDSSASLAFTENHSGRLRGLHLRTHHMSP
jgi:hypothetical protein